MNYKSNKLLLNSISATNIHYQGEILAVAVKKKWGEEDISAPPNS